MSNCEEATDVPWLLLVSPILIPPFHLLLAFDIPPLSGSPLASAQASLPPTSPPRGITTTPSPILPGLSLHIVNPSPPFPPPPLSADLSGASAQHGLWRRAEVESQAAAAQRATRLRAPPLPPHSAHHSDAHLPQHQSSASITPGLDLANTWTPGPGAAGESTAISNTLHIHQTWIR